MLRGVGTDIIEIARIKRIIDRYGSNFLDRLFTQKEQEYCRKYRLSARHFAGRFAAKEAIAKAMGTGIGQHARWIDIEIINDPHGRPQATLLSDLKHLWMCTTILVSISHCKDYATAFAVIF